MIFKFSFVASAILAVATAAPAQAASDGESASAPVRTSYSAQLGPHARDKYRDIFASIHAGEWADAAAKLDAMPEGPLHAVARAELYLAKGSPKVSGEALAALAEKAPDLPQAQALERLALSRGVATVTDLPAPQELRWLGSAPRRGKVAGSAARASAMSVRLVPLLKGDRPNEAEAILIEMTPELDPDTLTEWQQRIAWSYYLTGDDVAARRLAGTARTGYGDWAAQADWVAGLAAWRQQDWSAAREAFSSVAARSSDQEMVSAGYFWAARADMAGGHPERVTAQLKAASANSETFYGLLALNRLGLTIRPVDQSSLGNVESRPNVRAALALAEIDAAVDR